MSYHEKADYIGSTGLRQYLKSPAHYRYNCDNPKPPTPDMVLGSGYHTLILEPDKFDDRYYILDTNRRPEPDKTFASKLNKEWREGEITAVANSGLVTLDTETISTLYAMLEIMRQSEAYTLLKGVFEAEYYSDKFHGCKVKIKPDCHNDKFIIDLKTCQSAAPELFKNHAYKMGYHIQAALYLDVLGNIDGHKRQFVFIAQEKEPPYFINVFVASEAFVAQGRYEYEQLLKLHARCLAANAWPGYEAMSSREDGAFELDLPAYGYRELTINI